MKVISVREMSPSAGKETLMEERLRRASVLPYSTTIIRTGLNKDHVRAHAGNLGFDTAFRAFSYCEHRDH